MVAFSLWLHVWIILWSTCVYCICHCYHSTAYNNPLICTGVFHLTCTQHTHTHTHTHTQYNKSLFPTPSPLLSACYFNKEMAMHYHPGALLRNRWSCCRQHGKTSLGCQPTYHLLTRSSSRYAQMRRKDTLTSSHGSHGRRSKSTSLSRGEGRSATPEPRAREEARRSGSRGLSNSCCDLTHKQVQNRFDEPTAADTVSRHSSQLSNEPSISVGCITLTRVSLSELGGQPFSPPASTHVAKIGHPGRSKVVSTEGKSEGKSKGNRMQVAPEITSGIHSRAFPLSESHPHLPPRAPFTALPNRFTQSASTHFTPPSSHVTNYHCLTEPRRSRHSKTEGTANTQLSASTSLFPPKPVLEPKVSATDPNTIHF